MSSAFPDDWPKELGFYWCKQRYKKNFELDYRIGVCEAFMYPSESDAIFGDKIEPSFKK